MRIAHDATPISDNDTLSADQTVGQPATEEPMARLVAVTPERVSSLDIGLLRERVRLALRQDMPVAAQRELGCLLPLLAPLAEIDDGQLNGAFELATEALLAPRPKIALARHVRRRIQRRVLRETLLNASPAGAVSLGLGLFAYCVIPLTYFIAILTISSGPETFLGVPIATYFVVFVSSAFGSIVSIMSRLDRFHFGDRRDGMPLFLLGLSRPIVGLGFALFLFMALQSGIVTVPLAAGREPFLYAAIAFLAGFSERLGRSVAGRAEHLVVAESPPESGVIDSTVRA